MRTKILIGVCGTLGWIGLTLFTVAMRDEMRIHGQEHAFVKQLMAEREQALRDRAVLAEVVKYLEQQAKKAQ